MHPMDWLTNASYDNLYNTPWQHVSYRKRMKLFKALWYQSETKNAAVWHMQTLTGREATD